QGFFDLVIIDEASQCDIATALPLLQRAQSVVVCGDPKQLRHVSFMNEQKMRHLAQKNGLTALELETYNYRQKSVLDTFIEIIEKQEAITLLNEHFRSKPELIAFSNREFYENKLRVMTSNPYQSQGKALHFHKIEGQRINGINSEETRFVVDAVEKIRAINEKSPVAVQRSVGVLSPFRDQVNHMQQQLWERLGPAGFNQLQLLVGTAHSFQGEERDVMFISLSVDDEAHATALRHVNQLEVFNVSVTRARSEQHVVYSISPTNLAPKTLLNRYLSQSFVPAQEAVPNHRYDKFLNEVMALLNQLGYQQLYVNHSIAGVTFDLVVVATQGLLAIDLVGYSKQFEEAVQLERIQVFRRTGHKVFPIAYTDWIYRKQEVSNALNALL
ncbi:AAA family ATPase, partial [bacterium]|nr:AAA family ATPase [bacterium]